MLSQEPLVTLSTASTSSATTPPQSTGASAAGACGFSASLRVVLRRLLSRPLTYVLSTSIGGWCIYAFISMLRQRLREREVEDDADSKQHPQPVSDAGFELSREEEFYAFAFDYAGVCVAHAGNPEYVGLTMQQVFTPSVTAANMDANELHKRFVRTAEMGGGWCTYPWRGSDAERLRLKAAYIVPVNFLGRKVYAGVGYELQPPSSAAAALGLYAFLCDEDGTFFAHGASPDYVGLTLNEIVDSTLNGKESGESLLAKWRAATGLGGGWVSYKWRNRPDSPIRTKGAYLVKLERPMHGSPLVPQGNTSRDRAPLKRRVRTQYAGVGFFSGLSDDSSSPGADLEHCGRWTSATKAAALALKRDLLAAADDEAVKKVILDGSGALAATTAEALCLEEADLPQQVLALLQPARGPVALGVYGIIFDEDGRFLAHGASSHYVGFTFRQLCAERANVDDADAVVEQWKLAARRGGGWVRYMWRNCPKSPVYPKAAYVIRLPCDGSKNGCYAALCYGSESRPLPPDADELPKPPRVAPSRAAAKAAALQLEVDICKASARLSEAQSAAESTDIFSVLEPIIADAYGHLAAAAAVALGWEVTEVPAELACRLSAARFHVCNGESSIQCCARPSLVEEGLAAC